MLNIPQAVQDLFLSGTVHKNLRVHFPNGERADITNNQIVKESMKFNESLCSRDALKFGMSEASTIEFETVGVENVLGMTIEVGIEVDTSSLTAAQIRAIQYGDYDGILVLAADSDLGYGYYRVPLGVFVVTACPRSHGAMTHRRVIGYSAYYVMGDSLAPFNAWKLEQEYYSDGVNRFSIGTEFIFSNLYSNLPRQLVDKYFGYLEPEVTAYSVHALDAVFTGPARTYYDVRIWSAQQKSTLRARGCYHDGVTYTWDASSSESPLFQIIMTQAASARAALRSSVENWYNQQLVNISEAYYIDEYGRHVSMTRDEFIDMFTDDLLPPVRVVIPTGSGSYAKDLTYYIRPTEDDFSLILSGAGTYAQTRVYVPTLYGIHNEHPAPPWTVWLYSVNGSRSEHYERAFRNAPTGGELRELLPRQNLSLSAAIKPTGSRKVSGRTLYSYVGGVNIGTLLDGVLEAWGYFGKVSRLGGLILFYLKEDQTGTPATIDQTYSMPADIALNSIDDLWWDEYDIDKIGVVVYTYRNSTEDKEYTFTCQIGDAQGSVYRMVNNEFIRIFGENIDAEFMSDLLEDSFKDRVEQMGDYTPCEMTMQGMPWVEAGDFLRIETGAEDVPKVYTYMLQRSLSGIQHLTDKVVSVSGEVQINQ